VIVKVLSSPQQLHTPHSIPKKHLTPFQASEEGVSGRPVPSPSWLEPQ
jgi:hypothetical protein